jgi:hypothetical protein
MAGGASPCIESEWFFLRRIKPANAIFGLADMPTLEFWARASAIHDE